MDERKKDRDLTAMLFLDPGNSVPLHMQLERQMRQLILLGVWEAGSAVPPVRTLAARVGVNPNTAARVYRRLEGQSILTTVPGGGTYVAEKSENMLRSAASSALRPAIKKLVVEGIRLRLEREDVVATLEWEWYQLEGFPERQVNHE